MGTESTRKVREAEEFAKKDGMMGENLATGGILEGSMVMGRSPTTELMHIGILSLSARWETTR